LFACNLIPLISIMQILQRITSTEQDLSTAIQLLRSAIFTNSFIFLGLDIAGTSIYCEKTGGDYYDYLLTGEKGK